MDKKKLFKNRVYGVQIIKSKNSNYNADFTGAPRTLPDGNVYATDKVDKFNIRKYLGRNDDSIIFTKTTFRDDVKPRTLLETYEYHFGKLSEHNRVQIVKNLLTKLDVRLFGATFAPKGDSVKGKNISIHGPVQISYGVNRYQKLKDSGMFTDQIGSPYASKTVADQTTLGSQTRSQEAHYFHHYSINPKNLSGYVNQFYNLIIDDIKDFKKEIKEKAEKKTELNLEKVIKLKEFYGFDDDFTKVDLDKFGKLLENKKDDIKNAFLEKYNFQLLSKNDIQKLKESMALATTYYDSTSKKDSENELLLWIELNENSEKLLKNFTELINVTTNENGKTKIDFTEAKKYLDKFKEDISTIEIYYDDDFTEIVGVEATNNKSNNGAENQLSDDNSNTDKEWNILIHTDLNDVVLHKTANNSDDQSQES